MTEKEWEDLKRRIHSEETQAVVAKYEPEAEEPCGPARATFFMPQPRQAALRVELTEAQDVPRDDTIHGDSDCACE